MMNEAEAVKAAGDALVSTCFSDSVENVLSSDAPRARMIDGMK